MERRHLPRQPVLVPLATALGGLLALAGPVAAEPPRNATASPFEVTTPVEGVHLFRPPGPAGPRTNSLVVEREDGLLVVDAQPSPEAARELLKAVAAVSAKPVRYLVLTHSHADAAGGASAFPASVLVIASSASRDALADPSYDFGAEARLRAGANPWKEPARPRPTLVLPGPATLDDPRHPVVILPVRQSHSRGDLLVQLPHAGVVAIGDLVSGLRNPYGGDAVVDSWMATLNDIANMRPEVVMPLRGPAITARDVRLQRDALLWLKGEVHRGFVDQVPTGKIPERALQSPALRNYFDPAATPSFITGVAEQIVRETQEYRRKRGIE